MSSKNILTQHNIKNGFRVIDSYNQLGTVINCTDLHNVEILFDGEGLITTIDGQDVECGGCGIYCLIETCEKNDIKYTLYIVE